MGDEMTFRVQSALSAVLIEARSSVGPILFGTTSVTGEVTASIVDGGWEGNETPKAAIEVDLTGLASGNTLYDAELARRMDVRRHPRATVVLRDLVRLDGSSRYEATGELTLHGVSSSLTGSVTMTTADDGALVVEGQHVVDVREFNIPLPTALMLRIYPDVRVHLRLYLVKDEAGTTGASRGG